MVEIKVHIDVVNITHADPALAETLARIEQQLADQGVTLSDISDAVSTLTTDVTDFLDDATSDYAALNEKYLAALAADAVSQAEVDRITAEQAAAVADQAAQADRIRALSTQVQGSDLDPSNPAPVEPPADGGGDVPPADVPPADGGDGGGA